MSRQTPTPNISRDGSGKWRLAPLCAGWRLWCSRATARHETSVSDAGFGVNDISRFEVWKDAGRPLVSKVWCRCCKVALIEAAGASNDGNVSCSRFAQTTGAYVTALSELHWSRSRTLPFGTIDQWEGLVLSCAPSGGVDSSTRFTSGWVDASGAGQYESPD